MLALSAAALPGKFKAPLALPLEAAALRLILNPAASRVLFWGDRGFRIPLG
jgi:hypothetical protein